MQESLSLGHAWQVRTKQEYQGWLVPWEAAGYSEDARVAAGGGGVFDLSAWGSVAVRGVDAADFLNRMSTVDLGVMRAPAVAHGALLTGKAGTVAMGFLLMADSDSFHFVLPPPLATRAAEHLERFHFGEKLEIADESAGWGLAGLWSPGGRSALAGLPDAGSMSPLSPSTASIRGIPVEFWRDDARPALVWVRMKRDRTGDFFEVARSGGLPLLGYRLFEHFRIEAGVPQAGLDFGEADIVLESGFERAVAHNKGCYPGQEVVERIRTYGRVNRRIYRVAVEGAAPSVPCDVFAEGERERAGQLVSLSAIPGEVSRGIGLAFVHRKYLEGGEPSLVAAGGARVRVLSRE